MMNRVKITASVKIYEIDGEDTPPVDAPVVEVCTHWNHDELVVISTPEGKRYTVVADDFGLAIKRCSQ